MVCRINYNSTVLSELCSNVLNQCIDKLAIYELNLIRIAASISNLDARDKSANAHSDTMNLNWKFDERIIPPSLHWWGAILEYLNWTHVLMNAPCALPCPWEIKT